MTFCCGLSSISLERIQGFRVKIAGFTKGMCHYLALYRINFINFYHCGRLLPTVLLSNMFTSLFLSKILVARQHEISWIKSTQIFSSPHRSRIQAQSIPLYSEYLLFWFSTESLFFMWKNLTSNVTTFFDFYSQRQYVQVNSLIYSSFAESLKAFRRQSGVAVFVSTFALTIQPPLLPILQSRSFVTRNLSSTSSTIRCKTWYQSEKELFFWLIQRACKAKIHNLTWIVWCRRKKGQ